MNQGLITSIGTCVLTSTVALAQVQTHRPNAPKRQSPNAVQAEQGHRETSDWAARIREIEARERQRVKEAMKRVEAIRSRRERSPSAELLENGLTTAAIWLRHARKCDETIDQMVLAPEQRLTGLLVGAKLAWLRGNPSKAINALEQGLRKYDRSSQTVAGMPVRAFANLWIGTIARHFGDARRANVAYEAALRIVKDDKALRHASVLCHLYEAEVQSEILGSKDDAIRILQEIQSIEPPGETYQARIWNIYREWGRYKIAVLRRGTKGARVGLKPIAGKSKHSVLLATTQLIGAGVLDDPEGTLANSPSCGLFCRAALRLAIECRTSPIDRSLARLVLGQTSEQRKELRRAGEYYADLFASEAFFAPEGGLLLIQCLLQQNKPGEAEAVLREVRQHFPGYRMAFEDLFTQHQQRRQ